MTTRNHQTETAAASGEVESAVSRTDAPVAGTESTTAESVSTDPTTAETVQPGSPPAVTGGTEEAPADKASERDRRPREPWRATHRPPAPTCRLKNRFSATTSYRTSARAGTMSNPASSTIPESPCNKPTALCLTSLTNSRPASRRLAHGSRHSGLEAKRPPRRTSVLLCSAIGNSSSDCSRSEANPASEPDANSTLGMFSPGDRPHVSRPTHVRPAGTARGIRGPAKVLWPFVNPIGSPGPLATSRDDAGQVWSHAGGADRRNRDDGIGGLQHLRVSQKHRDTLAAIGAVEDQVAGERLRR